MVDIDKLLSALKVAPYVFLALAVASGIALFSPPSVQTTLGLDSLLVLYRGWIGATFLLSTSVFLSAMGAHVVRLFGPALRESWNTRQYRKDLTILSPPEQEVLAKYLRANTTTLSHHVSDGVVGGLVAKHILYRASNIGHPGSMSFDFNLQPWAWEELRRRPVLVGLPRTFSE